MTQGQGPPRPVPAPQAAKRCAPTRAWPPWSRRICAEHPTLWRRLPEAEPADGPPVASADDPAAGGHHGATGPARLGAPCVRGHRAPVHGRRTAPACWPPSGAAPSPRPPPSPTGAARDGGGSRSREWSRPSIRVGPTHRSSSGNTPTRPPGRPGRACARWPSSTCPPGRDARGPAGRRRGPGPGPHPGRGRPRVRGGGDGPAGPHEPTVARGAGRRNWREVDVTAPIGHGATRGVRRPLVRGRRRARRGRLQDRSGPHRSCPGLRRRHAPAPGGVVRRRPGGRHGQAGDEVRAGLRRCR